MKVQVKLFGMPELPSVFEGEKEVTIDFSGDTVKDLLHHLFLKIGSGKNGIPFNDQGEISSYISILINENIIYDSNPLRLKENDLIEIILPPD